MNPKVFFSRWYQGIKNLTPAQLLHSKYMGHIGQTIGMIFAFAVMLYKGYWYFAVFFVFALLLQILTLIETKQQYQNFIKMMEEL